MARICIGRAFRVTYRGASGDEFVDVVANDPWDALDTALEVVSGFPELGKKTVTGCGFMRNEVCSVDDRGRIFFTLKP